MEKVAFGIIKIVLFIIVCLIIAMLIVMSTFTPERGEIQQLVVKKNEKSGTSVVSFVCPNENDCTCTHFQFETRIQQPFSYSITRRTQKDTLDFNTFKNGLPWSYFRELYNDKNEQQNLVVKVIFDDPLESDKTIKFVLYPSDQCVF